MKHKFNLFVVFTAFFIFLHTHAYAGNLTLDEALRATHKRPIILGQYFRNRSSLYWEQRLTKVVAFIGLMIYINTLI